MNRDGDSEEIIHKMRYFRPSHELREMSQYCNFHYTVLTHILSQLSGGEPHHQIIQRRILDPLGLSVMFNHTEALKLGLRVSGFWREGINATRCRQVWDKDDTLDKSCLGRPVPVSWFLEGDGISVAGITGGLMSIEDGVSGAFGLRMTLELGSWLILVGKMDKGASRSAGHPGMDH